jgi:hypothetical protein
MLVGWYVPVTNVPVGGMGLPAASSSVRVTPVTGWLPTSDMMMAFCPPGPTSRMSMSWVKVWDKPFSLTVTFVMVPLNPVTAMFDG